MDFTVFSTENNQKYGNTDWEKKIQIKHFKLCNYM